MLIIEDYLDFGMCYLEFPLWIRMLQIESNIDHVGSFMDMDRRESQLLCGFDIMDVIVEEEGFLRDDACFIDYVREGFMIGFMLSDDMGIEPPFKHHVHVHTGGPFEHVFIDRHMHGRCIAEHIQMIGLGEPYEKISAFFRNAYDHGVPGLIKVLVAEAESGQFPDLIPEGLGAQAAGFVFIKQVGLHILRILNERGREAQVIEFFFRGHHVKIEDYPAKIEEDVFYGHGKVFTLYMHVADQYY